MNRLAPFPRRLRTRKPAALLRRRAVAGWICTGCAVAIAVDAHRQRVFLISSTGAIAVVGLRTNRVHYHSVKLPADIDGGDTYTAAWAGNGHLSGGQAV